MLPGGLRVLLGRFGDAPRALSGLLWDLLGPFWERFWVLWGSLGMLFGCFSGFGGRANAKTPKNLNSMTFCMDLLRFKGPRASKMRSKWSLRREKGERREKRAEKREKRAPQTRKVLDPRNCLRFPGPGGGSKIRYQETPDSCQGVGF